jgi:hypothetical protein
MLRTLPTRLTILAAAALLAAGCGGKKRDKDPAGKAATTDASCEKLGQRTVARSMEETPPGMPPDQVKVLRELSEEAGVAIAKRCKEDGWSPEAIACGVTAKNAQVECDAKLTAAQKEKMIAEVQAIFSKGMDRLMPPTPTPPAPPPPPLEGGGAAAPPAPPAADPAAPPTPPAP